ncbi:MAG TPA: hypothetical protein VH988_04740 [Thermoanaerobaculia bacterium]|jgi:hypothetical protein|nr:hypothetical protein [Thermoanaerobaculia bacterium]
MSSLAFWRVVEYASIGVIIVGVVGEYVSDFVIRDAKKKERLGKISTLVLIAGLALELPAVRLTEVQIAAIQLETARAQSVAESAKATSKGFEKDIAGANKIAKSAEEHAAQLEAEAAILRTKAANAERRLLELRQRMEPRHLTARQREAMTGRLSSGPKGYVVMFCTTGNAEACDFAKELAVALVASGWTIKEFTNSGVLTFPAGITIVTHSRVTPARLTTLIKAFAAAHIAVRINAGAEMVFDDIDLVISGKPQAATDTPPVN